MRPYSYLGIRCEFPPESRREPRDSEGANLQSAPRQILAKILGANVLTLYIGSEVLAANAFELDTKTLLSLVVYDSLVGLEEWYG